MRKAVMTLVAFALVSACVFFAGVAADASVTSRPDRSAAESRREKSFFIRNSFLADAGRGGGRPAKDGLSKGVCPDIIKGTAYRLSIHCTGLQGKRQGGNY